MRAGDESRETSTPSGPFSVSTIICSAMACFARCLAPATDGVVVEAILVFTQTLRKATQMIIASIKTAADRRTHEALEIKGAKAKCQGNS